MPDCSDSTYTYIDTTYTSHNALADVHLLQQLASLFVSNDCIVNVSPFHGWKNMTSWKRREKTLLHCSLSFKLKWTQKKWLRKWHPQDSQLHTCNLQLGYQKGAADSISNVLMERFLGKPRVTRKERVAANICNLFQNQAKFCKLRYCINFYIQWPIQ